MLSSILTPMTDLRKLGLHLNLHGAWTNKCVRVATCDPGSPHKTPGDALLVHHSVLADICLVWLKLWASCYFPSMLWVIKTMFSLTNFGGNFLNNLLCWPSVFGNLWKIITSCFLVIVLLVFSTKAFTSCFLTLSRCSVKSIWGAFPVGTQAIWLQRSSFPPSQSSPFYSFHPRLLWKSFFSKDSVDPWPRTLGLNDIYPQSSEVLSPWIQQHQCYYLGICYKCHVPRPHPSPTCPKPWACILAVCVLRSHAGDVHKSNNSV